MASIVELNCPENVDLGRGAVQNWRDLAYQLPGRSEAVRALLGTGELGSVLVVGPHDTELVAQLAARAASLDMVVRSAVDASDMGRAAPMSRVFCGDLRAFPLAGYDLVVALNDLALVPSSEYPRAQWRELADLVVRFVAPGGQLVLSVENERSDSRLREGLDPYVLDRDRDWSPFSTWDKSRPRTLAQLDAWRGAVPMPSTVASVGPTWAEPTAVAVGVGDPAVARAGAVAAAVDPRSSALALRSSGMAGRQADSAAGWVVLVGAEHPAEVIVGEDAVVERWGVNDGRIRVGCRTVMVPGHGTTAMVPVLEAIIERDLAHLRSLIQEWAGWVQDAQVGGVLPAESSDVRFSNLIALENEYFPLRESSFARLPAEAMWIALADLMRCVIHQGLPHPWPQSMTGEARLSALGAMAGLEPPTDLSECVPQADDVGQSRAELTAVVRRQQAELAIAWSRFRWDERTYLSYKAARAVKGRARKAVHRGRAATVKVKKALPGR